MYAKQGMLPAGTHSKPRTQLGTRETQLQEVTVLHKFSALLPSESHRKETKKSALSRLFMDA